MQGTGGSEPLGIRNTTGLTAAPSLGVDGRQPTYDDLKLLVSSLRGANVPFGSPGWILETAAVGGGFTLLGFPGRTTTRSTSSPGP